MKHRKEEFAKGVCYTLISAVGMSLVGLFGKLSGAIFSLTALVFWRFFAAFILCFIFFWLKGDFKNGFGKPVIKMHLLRALLVLGGQYGFYYYVERGSLLNGTMLLNAGPLFIPFVERFFLKREVGLSSWIAIPVAFIGVILVLQPNREIISLLSGIGLLAGISQGLSQIVLAHNLKEDRSDLGVFYLMLFCAFISLWPYLLGEATIGWGETGSFWRSVLLILLLGASSVLNQMARAVAYRHGSPSRLTVFLYFSVIMAGIWDILVFHIMPNTVSIIGTSLVILAGALKIYLRSWLLKERHD